MRLLQYGYYCSCVNSFFLYVNFLKGLHLLLVQNLRKGQFFGLQKIGTKKIPQFIRNHKQTDIERAKAMLLLASLPKFLPCRNKYVKAQFFLEKK